VRGVNVKMKNQSDLKKNLRGIVDLGCESIKNPYLAEKCFEIERLLVQTRVGCLNQTLKLFDKKHTNVLTSGILSDAETTTNMLRKYC